VANICGVCDHPDREAIDTDLIGGMPQRQAAIKYALGQGSIANHCKKHIRVPGKGETDSFRELRILKERVEKSLNRIESGEADDIERKQQASLMREHRTITEKMGSLSGEINSKTVSALLHRLGVKSEKELWDIVEERRKMVDITVEDLAHDCVKGLLDAFSMQPELKESVQAQLFPDESEPEMEE
jgi:transposase